MTLLQNSFFVTTFLLLFFCISVLQLNIFLLLFVVVSFFPLYLNMTYLNVVSLVVSSFFWSLTIFLYLSFRFSMSVCFSLSYLTTPIWFQSFCVHLATCLLFLPLFLALCVVLSIQFFFSLFLSFTQNIFSFPAYFQFYLSFCHVFHSSQFSAVFSVWLSVLYQIFSLHFLSETFLPFSSFSLFLSLSVFVTLQLWVLPRNLQRCYYCWYCCCCRCCSCRC